jgi:hypothetical protein
MGTDNNRERVSAPVYRTGEVMNGTAERVIEMLLKNAREEYIIQKNIGEMVKALNNPGFVCNKDFALTVCNALITVCINEAGMKEGSIMHLLGLRLMDYIKRI